MIRGGSRINRIPHLRHHKKKEFIEVYATTGNVSAASHRVGIDRTTIYKWRDKDEKFKLAMDEAEEEAVEVLEAEAHRRAMTGIEKPIFYKGVKVASVRDYSDTLLIFLLKAHKPKMYRDNVRVEHSQDKNNPPIHRTIVEPDRVANIIQILFESGEIKPEDIVPDYTKDKLLHTE